MITLIKFGKGHRLEEMRSSGLLFMQRVRYFREADTDPARSDPHEGSTRYYPGDYVTTFEIALPDGCSQNFRTDQVHFAPDSALRDNLFCMYGLGSGSAHIDERNRQFGEHALFFFDPQEFINRVVGAIKARNVSARCAPVEYVSRALPSPRRDPFVKFDDYAYQREYRILIKSGLDKPMKLDLGGSLADLCELVPFDELNKSIRLDMNLLPGHEPAAAPF